MYIKIKELRDKMYLGMRFNTVTGEYRHFDEIPKEELAVDDIWIATPDYNECEPDVQEEYMQMLVQRHQRDSTVMKKIRQIREKLNGEKRLSYYFSRLVEEYDGREEYRAYSRKRREEIAIEWCEEHGFAYSLK